jgi:hypothetical protein
MLPMSSRQSVPNAPRRQGKHSRLGAVLPRLLTVTLAALIALPLAETTPPVTAGKHNKHKRSKTITMTFSSNGQIDIPATGTTGPANPYPITIDVGGFGKFKWEVRLVVATMLAVLFAPLPWAVRYTSAKQKAQDSPHKRGEGSLTVSARTHSARPACAP